MLTLNEGREEPDVATLELAGPLPGGLQWLSGGKFLVSRSSDHDDDRLLEVLDPATGQRKATLALQVPSPGPSRPKGNSLPLPTPPPNSTETPSGWYETQSVLCADGSRLAAHFNNAKDESKRCQNRIGVWDVRGRKLLGTLQLPVELPPPPRSPYGPPGENIRIALSGDGSRLAVGGPRGTVAVYDVSKLSGLVKVTPGGDRQGDTGPNK